MPVNFGQFTESTSYATTDFLVGYTPGSPSSERRITLSNLATSGNTANKLVLRDASGNFSAGTITCNGATITGNLTVSSNNTTGGGIILSDDGSIVDNNDGYVTFKFSNGIAITNSSTSNTQQIQLKSNGDIGCTGNLTINGTPTNTKHAVTKDYVDKARPLWSSFKSNIIGDHPCYRLNTFLGRDKKVYIAGNSNTSYLGGQNSFVGGFRGFETQYSIGSNVEKFWVGPYNIFTYGTLGTSNFGPYFSIVGRNNNYQYGKGNNTEDAIQTNNFYFHFISGFQDFACSNANCGGETTQFIITNESTNNLYAWGSNRRGQCGNNSADTFLTTITRVNAGSIANKRVDKVWSIGDGYTTYGYTFCRTTDGRLHACGSNATGQLGLGGTGDTRLWGPVLYPNWDTTTVVDLVSNCWNGTGSTIILASNNRVYTTGHGGYYQHGNSGTTNRFGFAEPGGVMNVTGLITNIYAGGLSNGNLIVKNTTGQLWAWGLNSNNVFGRGPSYATNITSPVRLTDLNGTQISNATKVLIHEADNYNFCVILADNNTGFGGKSVYTSGYSGYGQTAYGGSFTWSNYFSQESFNNIVDVDVWGYEAGSGYTFATSDGQVFSRGYGDQGSTGTVTAYSTTSLGPQRGIIF